MAVIKTPKTDLQLRCEVILHKRYGVTSPEQLTSAERHQAYVAIKQQLEPTARSLEDFEQKCKQIAEYLQI